MINIIEVWMPIRLDGYEGIYEASNLGRVRSIDRIFTKSNGRLQPVKSKVLSQRYDKDGYLKVSLSYKGEERNAFVHRLVASAFIENEDNLPQVNHKNSIRDDNCVENLEWVTEQQNSEHAYTYGNGKRGIDHENSKQVLIKHNGDIISIFESLTKCCTDLDITRSNLRRYIKTSRLLFGECEIEYVDLTSISNNKLNIYPFKRKLTNFQSKPVVILDKSRKILSAYESRLSAEKVNNFPETVLMRYKTRKELYKGEYYIEDITQYEYLTFNDEFINKKL